MKLYHQPQLDRPRREAITSSARKEADSGPPPLRTLVHHNEIRDGVAHFESSMRKK